MAALRLDGLERFDVPASVVLEKLADAVFLANCVPEVQILEATRDRSVLHVPPGTTMLPGKLQVELVVLERHLDRAVYRIVNRATGATGTAEVQVHVVGVSETLTHVSWSAEVVQVTGLLRMMPKSVIRSGVERAAPRMWSRIRESL